MTTDQCLAKEQLRSYLQGWTEPNEVQLIEEHLRQCAMCEETLCSLEQEPDTLAEFLRKTEGEVEENHPSQDRLLDYALAKSKSLGQHAELSHPAEALAFKFPLQQMGPYQIMSALGRGGMGTVYLAKHRELNKQVAIKILPTNKFHDAASRARFQREFRAVGQLNHPSIVCATDAGEIDGVHFLAMEYVEGFDLSKIVRAFGPLRIADACCMVRAAALGLSYAHSQGVVHRDIKPSNIMLRNDGVVKLLDFGLAQTSLWDEATAEITTVGQLMGTLDYMAPEQAHRPDLVDHRTDIYSLGATLYRLLTGRPPLVASPNLSPLAKLKLLGSTEPPRLQTLRADAPDTLCKLVSQLLDRSPDKRPSSAAHVAELLDPFTQNADLRSLVETTQRLVTEQHPQSADEDIVSLQAAPASTSDAGSRSNRYWKWVAAACLPLLILAATFIALETQKGQLIIESNEANVQVSIRRDGTIEDKVQIVPGTNVTKLYAGTYEVVIEGTPERYSLDKQSITLQRGQVAIARITLKEDAQNIIASDAKPTTGTVFQGKSIDEWLIQLETERDPVALSAATSALFQLINSSDGVQYRERLFARIEAPANPIIGVQNDAGSLHYYVIQILAQTFESKEELCIYLAQKIRDAKDSNTTSAIARAAFRPGDTYRLSRDCYVPLFAALEYKLEQRAIKVYDEQAIASFLIPFANHESMTDSDAQQWLQMMSKLSGADVWFYSSTDVTAIRSMHPAIVQTRFAKNIERFLTIRFDDKPLAFITCNLRQNIQDEPASKVVVELTSTHRTSLIEHTKHLLEQASQSESRLRQSVIYDQGDGRFLPYGMPIRFTKSLPNGIRVTNVLQNSSQQARAIPAIELLRLLDGLNGVTEAAEVVKSIFSATERDSIDTQLKLLMLEGFDARAVSFEFVNLRLTGLRSSPTGAEEPWRAITSEQWIGYFIHQQVVAVLPDELKETILIPSERKHAQKALEIALPRLDLNKDGRLTLDELYLIKEEVVDVLDPSEISQQPLTNDQLQSLLLADKIFYVQQTNEWRSIGKTAQRIAARKTDQEAKQKSPAVGEPIYRGKTLSEWMTLFNLERDPTELNTAFEAIISLAEGKEEAAVEQFLLQEMKSNPDRRLENGNSENIMSIAAAVFNWRMSPDRSPMKIVDFAMSQLKSDDQQWIIRFLPMIPNRIKHLDDQSLQPFYQWCEKAFENGKFSGEAHDAIASCLFTLYLNPNKEVRPDVDRLIRLAATRKAVEWAPHVENLITAVDSSAVELLEWLAVRDLEDVNASDQKVATSVVVLLMTNGAPPQIPLNKMQAPQIAFNRLGAKPVIVTDSLKRSLANQLNRMLQMNNASNRYTMTDLNISDRLQSLGIAYPNPVFGSWLWSGVNLSKVETVAVANLVQLTKLLRINSEFQPLIQEIVQANRDRAVQTSTKLFPFGFESIVFRQHVETKQVSYEHGRGSVSREPFVVSTPDLIAVLNYWAALEALESKLQTEELTIYLRELSKNWTSAILERLDTNHDLTLSQLELDSALNSNELKRILVNQPSPTNSNLLEKTLFDYFMATIKESLAE